MGGQGDQVIQHRLSWRQRVLGALRQLGADSWPARRAAGENDKTVYYSSDLFSATMMIDATRRPVDKAGDQADR